MSSPSAWWESFFDAITLDLWRLVFTEEQSKLEADFLAKALELQLPAKILDAPCGEGRLARQLALRGFEMTGVDFSPAFLEEARHRADELHLEIAWRQADMRHLDWQQEFDGAFCMGGSFGYFDDAGNASFLKSVAQSLKPGAKFVLDASRVAEGVLPSVQEREWVRVGDILFLQENHYDHVHGRMETEYTFIRDGQVQKKTSSDRVYTYREHCQLLEEAGFTGCDAYSSFSLEPYKLGSPQLFLVARKA